MNVWDILILLAVAGLLFLAVRTLRKSKAAGCSSCGSCSACSSYSHCARSVKKK